jgi:mycoredoxin
MPNVKVHTTSKCSDCRAAKRFLNENSIAYEEINIEHDHSAVEIIMRANPR